jgi:hypothetical protein
LIRLRRIGRSREYDDSSLVFTLGAIQIFIHLEGGMKKDLLERLGI